MIRMPSALSSASSIQPTGHHIPALTGLRALAGYLVFLHHHNPATPGTLAHSLFNQGYVGVSIFFVLSGFVIYHRYAGNYLSQKEWSYWRYLRYRFARIYPLYALLLLLTIGVRALAGNPMNLWSFVLSLTLLKGLFESTKFSGIPQSWSLTVELCFYGLAPLLFTGLQRWGAFRLTVGLIGGGLFLWLLVSQIGPVGSLPFFLFYTFFGRAFEFVVGMTMARRWHKSQLAFLRNASWAGLCLTAGCISWQACLDHCLKDPICLLISEVIVYNGLLPMGIGLFLMGFIDRRTLLQWLFAQPISQALGYSSYAFYLIQIGVITSELQKLGVTNHWLLFGTLVGIAHILYSFIEKPLHKRLIRRPATG